MLEQRVDHIIEQVERESDFSAVRSRGPGGQNVNKVSSAAVLNWNIETSQLITEEERWKIRQKLGGWINKEDELYIRSDSFRDLEQNKRRCLEKLRELLLKAFFVPKARKKTKPTRASKERKLKAKKIRSETKYNRRKDNWD